MSFRHFYVFVVILMFFRPTALSGQLTYLHAKAHIGSIIKHRTTITFPTDQLTSGFDLSMYWQMQGSKDWHQHHHYPRLYASLGYDDLGDNDILGNAVGMLGGIELPLFRRQKSAMHFGVAFGYSYLTKPFDRITNPTNNAIGSHINNAVLLAFEYEHQISKKYRIHAGLQIKHFSNGSRKRPNLGLNIPAVYLAFSPHKNIYKGDIFNRSQPSKTPERRFAIGLSAQYATVEIRVPGGPDYPVYVFATDLFYHLNANNRLSLGYQYGYHSSVAVFGLYTGDFNDNEEAFVGASRHSISLGHEFLFGPWAIHLQAGMYANPNTAWLLPRPFYFQASPRYYFNAHTTSHTKFFANLKLKSHLFVAEFISVGVGVVFQ